MLNDEKCRLTVGNCPGVLAPVAGSISRRFAYKVGTAAPVEFLDAITQSNRLVFQIGDERGLVEFADTDARAVDELKRRCALVFAEDRTEPEAPQAEGSRGATADTLAALDQALASAASAAAIGGSNGAGDLPGTIPAPAAR